MSIKSKLLGTAVALASLVGASSAFAAGNLLTSAQQQPGLTAGLSTGTPLPTGVYEVGILDWGSHAGTGFEAGVLVPINLIWSTPWEILGGRPFFQFANAEAYIAKPNQSGVGPANALYLSGNFENVLGVGMGWNLGNGFSVTIEEEYYPGIKNQIAPQNYGTFSQEAAIAWHGADGWGANAHIAYGTGKNSSNGFKNSSSNNFTGDLQGSAWLDWDFAITKSFGKWEVGAFVFGENDLGTPFIGFQKASEVAVGGLVGYNFGPVIAQLKLSPRRRDQEPRRQRC